MHDLTTSAGTPPAPDTTTLMATVAADANGRTLRDAKVHVRYLRPGDEHGVRFLEVAVPWRADSDRVAAALLDNGYRVRVTDLVVPDGYELHLGLQLASYSAWAPECDWCGAAMTTVESRFEDRGPCQHIHITRHVCRSGACGRIVRNESDGG
ncbi:hypothetical protein [Micromonospora sp. NPDC005652]|uniref:hypothetical protein n=1 Tax=Micromonospora sp. NPDC005652 TaxID=3157046 RepID=UPI0033DA79EF